MVAGVGLGPLLVIVATAAAAQAYFRLLPPRSDELAFGPEGFRLSQTGDDAPSEPWSRGDRLKVRRRPWGTLLLLEWKSPNVWPHAGVIRMAARLSPERARILTEATASWTRSPPPPTERPAVMSASPTCGASSPAEPKRTPCPSCSSDVGPALIVLTSPRATRRAGLSARWLPKIPEACAWLIAAAYFWVGHGPRRAAIFWLASLAFGILQEFRSPAPREMRLGPAGYQRCDPGAPLKLHPRNNEERLVAIAVAPGVHRVRVEETPNLFPRGETVCLTRAGAGQLVDLANAWRRAAFP